MIRGEHRAAPTGDLAQDRVDQVRRCRLALGPRDPDDGQLALRVTVELGGQEAHRLQGVSDDKAGAGGQRAVLPLSDVGHHALLLGREEVVLLEAALDHEQRSRGDHPGVIDHRAQPELGQVIGVHEPPVGGDDLAQDPRLIENPGSLGQAQLPLVSASVLSSATSVSHVSSWPGSAVSAGEPMPWSLPVPSRAPAGASHRVAGDGAGHAVGAAPPPHELDPRGLQHLDAGTAQDVVGGLVVGIADDPSRSQGDDVA